jgi:hypothetical protein
MLVADTFAPAYWFLSLLVLKFFVQRLHPLLLLLLLVRPGGACTANAIHKSK